ncbi:MAG: adenylyltransferase/cytidyltransferase family protein [Magnetococcales bacterium]|nr:adenylyltransferase/cytidyltransferase family protein [Magnetococcales bacterium]
MLQKIIAKNDLVEKVRFLQEQERQIVYCHGTFNSLHLGDILNLRKARQEGDVLVVSIATDRFVSQSPSQSAYSVAMRAESIAELSCVDWVIILDAPNAVSVIREIQPDLFLFTSNMKESDQNGYSSDRIQEKNAVEAFGGRLLVLDKPSFTGDEDDNDILAELSPSVRNYLHRLKKEYSATDIIHQAKSLKSLKVLVVGEAIVDEYCYSTPMGMTGKSGNIISVHYGSNEFFAGGSLAVANHLAEFAGEVTLLTGLGKDDVHEPFIRGKLAENVTPNFYYFNQGQTLVKKRYIDKNMNKLFEVYLYDNAPLSPSLDAEICQWINRNAKNYDVVLVADYGNGFISSSMVSALSDSAKFLAVNTQINSGNRGHHVITRYPNLDYASINEPEVRLATHNRHDPITMIADDLAAAVKAKYFAITMGQTGAVMLNLQDRKAHDIPALSTHVVDRIGAGDAFLSLSGLCLAGGIHPKLALFLGSAAAALDVAIVCNRQTVGADHLFGYIKTLME